MSIDLNTLTIEKAHKHLTDGDFSAVELAQAFLNEIKKKNKDLNAYLEVFDDVLEQAKEADKKIKEGNADILTGIPIAVKDNILIKGRRVGAASKILEGYRATYDATAIAKLKEKGVVFLGRTNMDEFAMGGSTENSAYGPVNNPHDESRVPGGSSGGSAVAVAANMALGSLGSDTGGSVRQPASFCGVVGFKPTYGAVSRSGLIALGSSLDQIGTFGKTARDAEILFNAIRGDDPLDSTSLPDSMWKEESRKENVTIGVPRHLVEREGIDVDVLQNFNDKLDDLKKKGATIKDIELPTLEYSLPVYYIIMPAEASSNLARFDGVKYGLHADGHDLLDDYLKTREAGFGAEPKRRILLGTYVLSAGYYDAYYNKATAVRGKIKEELSEAFENVDVIATPTSPVPAFKIGEKSGDPLSMYLADIFTVSANIAGIPGISIPSGVVDRDGKKLPVGFQLMASEKKDNFLFDIAEKVS